MDRKIMIPVIIASGIIAAVVQTSSNVNTDEHFIDAKEKQLSLKTLENSYPLLTSKQQIESKESGINQSSKNLNQTGAGKNVQTKVIRSIRAIK